MPVPPFAGNISFNAQHCPMGAFFSFTCGHFGTRGGFGLQSGRPGNQDLFIGVKDGDRQSDAPLKCLPFYEGASNDEAARYDVEKKSTDPKKPGLVAYGKDDIQRYFGWATDRWVTPDFEFTIFTSFGSIPEHNSTSPMARLDLRPTVVAELVIDNTQGTTPKTGFFATRFTEPGIRMLDQGLDERTVGFAHKASIGAAGRVVDYDFGESTGKMAAQGRVAFPFCRWDVENGLKDPVHLLGSTPGIGFEVPAGEKLALRLALGAFLEYTVTTRLNGRYRYTRYFGGLTDCLGSALYNFDLYVDIAHSLDEELLDSGLSVDQQFLIAHSTRSYYGSTQLLDIGGQPFWVVNEGEYCMLNTLDLSVDHVFWELKHNPWVVKNLLNNFVTHYSYVDQVKVPKATNDASGSVARTFVRTDDTTATGGTPRVLGAALPLDAFDLKPGGISFCHDMGVHNNFSPYGNSSYELPDLVGCFSYMTAEQLCNWLLIAACYVSRTRDTEWARHQKHVVDACLQSMINRGPEHGITQYDSSRCVSGAEITTYDSLDHSLAQTRNNLYMAVKCWASYLAVQKIYDVLGLHPGNDPKAALAQNYADRCARAIVAQVQPDGTLPAVFEKDNPGYVSRILPAVEGLVYPLSWNDDALSPTGRYAKLLSVLKTHTVNLLKDPQRRNLFPDGGIRLSSTSSNSWMSKISIVMHVCREVFDLDQDAQIRSILQQADEAHVKWQTEPQGEQGSAYWACSDQMVDGVAKGSKYYPRIITSALWME